jgi:gluconate 2-dehydrogenase gamma chain
VTNGNREPGSGNRDDVRDASGNPWGNEPMPDEGAGDGSHILWGAPPENHDADEPAGGHHHPSAPIGESTAPVSRRRALQVLGILGAAGAASALGAQQTGTGTQQQSSSGHAAPNPNPQQGQPARNTPKPAFFTRAELRTVGVLANDIIPKDERSGSATDAGVPAFIDFNLSVPETDENTRTAWRGGLRWLDTESKRRHGVAYAAATRAQRHAILDDIAYPDKVTAQLRPGNAFFMRARDMIASGFFSSAIGFQDLKWQGNTFNPNWNGCPQPALDKLGVSYDVMSSRVGLKPGE